MEKAYKRQAKERKSKESSTKIDLKQLIDL